MYLLLLNIDMFSNQTKKTKLGEKEILLFLSDWKTGEFSAVVLNNLFPHVFSTCCKCFQILPKRVLTQVNPARQCRWNVSIMFTHLLT